MKNDKDNSKNESSEDLIKSFKFLNLGMFAEVHADKQLELGSICTLVLFISFLFFQFCEKTSYFPQLMILKLYKEMVYLVLSLNSS